MRNNCSSFEHNIERGRFLLHIVHYCCNLQLLNESNLQVGAKHMEELVKTCLCFNYLLSVQDFSVSASQRGHYQTEVDVSSISTQICSNPGTTCGRNISNSPWKPGMLNTPGTGNQKSLNRLRVGRGRGKSRGVWLNSEASVLKSSKYSHHPSHITSPLPKNKGTNFTGEVKRKQTADEIIQSQEKNCTSLYLLEEQQRLTLEREARLQVEINKLHKELSEQKQLLKENHDVMRQLQEQLMKVQSQQFRSNIQAERGHAIKSTAKPESKVCTVM
ncbi:uncharacterized protein LOC116991618 [Amblyraja radiata]|uniref:uncharacterized protein LOC116991618 n=1 Tax=Amblyraja radiata TaxID=386614 RepID=UPI00140296AC|nr:uncharacterized protein LOC116991618 [Amblyraja radiata]